MNYKLYKEVSNVVSKSIHIVGATRSGTTIFEKLISSLKNVECFDEPAMLRVLMPLINNLSEEEFKILFEGYLFEERLMYSLPGRNLNLNKHDMTSIYNSKPLKEINSRLNKSYRRMEIFPRALKCSIAFKQVEIGDYLKPLSKCYPKMRSILLIRSPIGVINSINQKEWFGNKQLFGNSGKWFFKKGVNWNLPDWLKKEDIKKFINYNQSNRALMYYKSEYKNFLSCLKSKNYKPIIIDYDDFTKNPDFIFKKTVKNIGENYGKLTRKILKTIKPNSSVKKPPKILDKKLFDECFKLYTKCYYFNK